MFTLRRAVAASAAAIALVAGALASAAPAQAATQNLSMTGPNSGTIGSTVTYTVSGSFFDGYLALQDQNGTTWATTQLGLGAKSPQYLSFQIPQSGSPLVLTASAYDTNSVLQTYSNSIQLNFASTGGTHTTISAPNNAKVGVATKIQANVNMLGGSTYSPTGNVVFTDQNGNVVSTNGLTQNGPGKSYAYWWWTPTAPGTYIFTATYQGDGTAQGSTSQQDAINASGSGSTITLTAPGTLTVGVPVMLVATLVPSSIQGSVGFTFNGQPISASIPIVNGRASFQWTPTVPGTATLGASYTTNGGQSGSTSDKVNIVAGPVQQDVITLVQPGWGPWTNGGTYQLGNGTNFTFQASALSGAQVQIGETGPCSVSGLTLVVPVGSGQCNITSYSPGGNGYAAVQYGYTVIAVPGTQTALLTAPQSGPVNKGRTLTLESPAQVDTNAGQNITWKITKGKNKICKLKFPSSGAVKIKMLKKGQCNVKGTAPGVPGQWNPYTVYRSYRVV